MTAKGVLNVDIFALEKENAPASAPITILIAPLGLSHFSIAARRNPRSPTSSFRTRASRHSFVPEQRDFYESWVDFTVKDSSGKVLSESGFIKPDGTSIPRRIPSPTASSTPRAS